ncbi:uncharacterized protein SEPMUDRAFT_147181 [Sphaerulina musiva SO2202]|uniref:Uncharacterized protein n=1 Tax=Sphaerulina musiva (strain SO2202) TaxID=692275 RepID=M3DBM2_SPHMS|nr:uncharacterized protein SEPMUDRAFT_147181 [Sphaerulina musiva SO2202]EMF15259.1 hypothetical protein SEPMUDRAFT_147181 [Sphaerulina musiva SO2202]
MTSADPRLKNTGKRPASRSPDGNRNASSSTNKRHTGPLRVSSSYQATNDLAPASVKSPGNASDASSSMAVVEGFFKATTTAAELSIELKAAQTAHAKADREFRNMQDKFDLFPAIKDQKTHARDRAHQRLVRIQRQIEEQKPLQTQVCATLASLLDRRGSSDQSHAAGLLHSPNESLEHMESTLSRISDAAVALSKRVHALESQSPRLDAIESRIKEIADDGIADKEDIIKDVDGLGDRVEAIARDSVVLRKDIDDQLSSNKTRFADLKKDSAELRRAVTDQLVKALDDTNILDHNTKTVNECMARLQKLEAAALSESNLNSVQQTISSLQGKLQALENTKPTSTAAPGAAVAGKSVWQPVLPENDLDSNDHELLLLQQQQQNNPASLGPSSSSNGPSTTAASATATRTYVLNEIEMLKALTMQHTRIINNLTTDDIVKQMLDQLSTIYPDIRMHQQSLTAIRSEVQSYQKNLLHQIEKQEDILKKGREEIVGKLEKLEKTVGVLVDGAETIREHSKKVLEVQVMVLKLEEVVKKVLLQQQQQQQQRKGEAGGGGGDGGQEDL